INDSGITNVVFIAADIHGTVVNNLTYQESVGGPQIPTSAFEVTVECGGFNGTFGPAVMTLGLEDGEVSLAAFNAYLKLPVANDSDSNPNDEDDVVKNIVDKDLATYGYDPIGLNHNLPQADGLVHATLVQGDYIAVHGFGWSEFIVDPATQTL